MQNDLESTSLGNLDITSGPDLKQWHWKDVLLILAVAGLIFVAGAGLLRVLIKMLDLQVEEANTQLFLSLSALVLETVALLLPVYWIGVRKAKLSWSEIGLQPIKIEWGIVAVILGFIAIPLSGFIALIIQLLLGKPLENPQLPFLAPGGFSWFAALSMFIMGGFVAPFAEEIFFRSVLYNWLRQRWGIPAGILVSSFLFGILHGEFSIAAAAFVLGFILAWIYEYSKSIWASFIIHAINNGLKIALLYALLASGLFKNYF
jgi:membrane protease YdiL (CAAX protease family)